MFIGFRLVLYWGFANIHRVAPLKEKSRKTVAAQSEIGNLGRFQLKLQFVSDKGNEFRIRGFSFGIADSIAEISLECVQVPSVPGHFNGVSDSTLHSGWCGLKGFRHLGVEYFCDGIGVPYGPPGSFLDGVCETSLNNKFCGCIYCFISCPYHCWFVGLIPMITKSNFLVKFEGNKHLKKVFSEQIKPKVIVKTNELFEINSN